MIALLFWGIASLAGRPEGSKLRTLLRHRIQRELNMSDNCRSKQQQLERSMGPTEWTYGFL